MEEQSLELQPRIRQEVLLAPCLRASLRVLQMDRQALVEELHHEAEVNPVIDLEEGGDVGILSQEMRNAAKREEAETVAHETREDYLPAGIDELAAERRQRFFDGQEATESLQEHLLAQARNAELSPDERQLAELLIGDIDDNGRYVGAFEDLSDVLGASDEELERVLAHVQTFDPPGVGGRDLRECLLIQARQAEVAPVVRAVLEELVSKHLEELAACGEAMPEWATKAGVSRETYAAARLELLAFDPRPGRSYLSPGHHTEFIRPEVTVTADESGYRVAANDGGLPTVHINAEYEAMSTDASIDGEARQYLERHLDSARTLMEALSRRGETILRIAEVVFDVQKGFFKGGFGALKPLTIEEVARRTGYHGTTVGRAIRGKYAATPRGLFELKRFFCVGHLKHEESPDISAVAVKRRLSFLVENEATMALTDADLAAALGRGGVTISRRTVAKYRSEMGIPAAAARGRKQVLA